MSNQRLIISHSSAIDIQKEKTIKHTSMGLTVSLGDVLLH